MHWRALRRARSGAFRSRQRVSGARGARTASPGSWCPEIVIDEAVAGNSALLERVGGFASSGARVVALVRADSAIVDDELPDAREVAAIVVLEEDLREDAAETLDYFRSQGVHVRVISGDNPTTVGALAAQAGLTAPDGMPARLMDARDLPEDLSSEAFIDAIEKHDVFGRVTPEQKRAMVGALQAREHCVAMTGRWRERRPRAQGR